jgi:cytosine/adenosine deaminase-related metal-dependent hydrolase
MGPMITLPAASQGLTRLGLGSDVACSNPADMFTQMRLFLQHSRHAESTAYFAKNGLPPPKVPLTCLDALYYATLGSAKAVHLEQHIGSITPGKRADLLLVRTTSPRLTPMSDPVAALVMYAQASDVEMVFVDGKIVKKDGQLVGADWKDLGPKVRRSADEIRERASEADMGKIMEGAQAMFSQAFTRAAETRAKEKQASGS